MFDIGSSELLLIAIVALVVIGPKDLPRVLYQVGQWVGKARGMARHFRTGIDAMVREAELEDLEKKWAAENRRIMAQHPGVQAEDHDQPEIAGPQDTPRAVTLAEDVAGDDGALPLATNKPPVKDVAAPSSQSPAQAFLPGIEPASHTVAQTGNPGQGNSGHDGAEAVGKSGGSPS